MGILWQHNMSYYDKEEYNAPGQLIKVDGHNMHIYAVGPGNVGNKERYAKLFERVPSRYCA